MSTTSAHAGVSDRIEQVYFALIGSKHEIGRVWIIWIALRCAASGRDSAVDHCEVTFKLNLQSRSHTLLVGLNRGIQSRDGLQIGALTRKELHGMSSLRRLADGGRFVRFTRSYDGWRF